MNGIVSNTVNAMKKEKGAAVTNVLTLTTLHSNNNVNISNNSNGNNNSTAYNDNTCKETYPGLFNKIVLTSENSLIPKEKLNATPSSLYGLDQETEMDLRILGCELIQTAGILLRLPQVAMATGQVLFQRFFYAKSFVHHNMATVAMSCVTLASKIEETPRCIRDVINVFHHMKQVRTQTEITPLVLDKHYTDLKTEVIKEERRVLKELGFCVHAKHPHKLIVMYLKVLQHEKHAPLMQFSWNFMNDSLRTDVFMRFTPESIACACIYLGARKLNIPLPQIPPWFGLFKVSAANITDICYRIMELYTRAKPNAGLLDSTVKNLKRRYIDARNLNKKTNLSLPLTAVDSNDGSHDGAKGDARLVNRTHSKRSHCDWDDYRARERYRNRGWNLARSGARARSPTKDEKKNIKLFAHSSSMPSKNCK